jgi:hypothetical protein
VDRRAQLINDQVLAVAEFLRDDPLDADFRRMGAALRSVAGAESVWEEDREVWGVIGTPSGEALVRAAAGVVDRLAPRRELAARACIRAGLTLN